MCRDDFPEGMQEGKGIRLEGNQLEETRSLNIPNTKK